MFLKAILILCLKYRVAGSSKGEGGVVEGKVSYLWGRSDDIVFSNVLKINFVSGGKIQAEKWSYVTS